MKLRYYGPAALAALAVLFAGPALAQTGDDWMTQDFGMARLDDSNLAWSVPGETDSDRSIDVSFERNVDFDEDEILRAIALHNAGFSGVSIGAVNDADSTRTINVDQSQDVDFDRDDVFGSLIAGFDGTSSQNGAGLTPVSDSDSSITQTMTWSREFDLDEDDTFAALALSTSLDSAGSLAQVADLSIEQSETLDVETEDNIEEEDAFLFRVLGGNSMRGMIP